MPFTFSHPAAVLPLVKRYKLSATAMIIGSMVPDFEFFFRLKLDENIGHKWYGIVIFDLPMTILLSIIFHLIIKQPLVGHLPTAFQRSIDQHQKVDWLNQLKTRPMIMILSALIGIVTHFLLDGFTHHDGFMIDFLPWLSHHSDMGGVSLPNYLIIQIMLSVLGLLILTIYVYNKVYNQHKIAGFSLNWMAKPFWYMFVLSALAIFSIRVALFPEYNFFWSVVMAFFGSIAYGLIISSSWSHLKKSMA